LTDPADDREQLISFKGRLVASACSWVIKNSMYANWLDGSNQSQLLWLCGASGTGKTMLSIFLTEWLQKNLQGKTSAVLLYYFCDSRDERRNHAVYILRGMIYQLLQKRPELFKLLLPDYLVQKANLFKQHSLEPLWRIFESMTRDPATGPVYCVIDGLDECHSGSLEHFLKKVKMFYSAETNGPSANSLDVRPPSALEPLPRAKANINERNPMPNYGGLKMMLVSRKEPTCLPSELATFPRLDLALDASNDYSNGLRSFIDAKVARMSVAKGYSDHEREKVSQALQERSEGSFLWAGMAIDEISTSGSTPMMASDDIHRLPQRVDDMYIEALRRIPSQRRAHMVAVFRWVVLARRPLKLPELSAAINISPFTGGFCQPHELYGSITSCSKLLSVTGEEVALAHQSVKDFFLKGVWTRNSENADLRLFKISEDQVHADIASACLQYITSGSLKAGKAISVRNPSFFEGGHLRKWPFLAYALIHWPDHARMTSSGSIDFSSPLFSNKSKLYEAWWESYWIATGPAAAWTWVAPKDFNLAHLACYCGILSLAIELKNIGVLPALVNASDSHTNVPASYAVKNGHEAVLAFMLDNGAGIEYKYGGSLLHDAAMKGQLEMVNLILARGVHPDTQGDIMDRTSLKLRGLAAVHAPMVDLQFAKESKDNSHNWHLGASGTGGGDHPLHKAAEYGHEDVVKILITKGARINAQTTGGFTPLHFAAFNGQKRVVQLLIESQASIDAASKEGWTPLHSAARTGNTETVRLLISRGCNIHAVTTKLKTALHFAVVEGHLEAAQLLIRLGSNLDAVDHKGRTALLLAQELNKIEIVQSLVNAGADTELAIAGQTALARAKTQSQWLVVSVLERGPVSEEEPVSVEPPVAVSAYTTHVSEKSREERSCEPSMSKDNVSPPPTYYPTSPSSSRHAFTPAPESRPTAASSTASIKSPISPSPRGIVSSNAFLDGPEVFVSREPISRVSPQVLEEDLKTDARNNQAGSGSPDSLQVLQALWSTFYTEWAPACMDFIMNPPTNLASRHKRYHQLSEGILTEVLFAADEVKIETNPEAKEMRKKLVDHANEFLSMLDNIPRTSSSPAPLGTTEDRSRSPSRDFVAHDIRPALPPRPGYVPYPASVGYGFRTGDDPEVDSQSSGSLPYDPPALFERRSSPYLMSSSNNQPEPPSQIITASPPTLPRLFTQDSSTSLGTFRRAEQPLTNRTSYSYPPALSQRQSSPSAIPPTSPPPLPPRSPTLSPPALYPTNSYPPTSINQAPLDTRRYSADNRASPYLSPSVSFMAQQPSPHHSPRMSPLVSPPGVHFPPPPQSPSLRESSSQLSFRGRR
jgi:ankyrin repeat protein